MQILEVRFYPRTKAIPSFVVVGRVICGREEASIELAPVRPSALEPFDTTGLLAKLRFLVDSAAPEPGPGLLGLRSDFWSFVEVPPAGGENGPG